MLKIQIKNRWTGSILFEYEKENNTIKETLVEAAKKGAYLQGAYLQGANLQGEKISKAIVFTGLYKYIVIPYITEEGVKRVKMGCHNRTLEEWENDFWNNPNEFPNNDSVDSNLRLMAFNTAKEWFKIVTK